jgi:hypothetical protein
MGDEMLTGNKEIIGYLRQLKLIEEIKNRLLRRAIREASNRIKVISKPKGIDAVCLYDGSIHHRARYVEFYVLTEEDMKELITSTLRILEAVLFSYPHPPFTTA